MNKGYFDMPYGPHEVLFLKPTEPGVFSPVVAENALAYRRARDAYKAECLDISGELTQFALLVGGRPVPVGATTPKRNRKPGLPSFGTFFNSNLDRWYQR